MNDQRVCSGISLFVHSPTDLQRTIASATTNVMAAHTALCAFAWWRIRLFRSKSIRACKAFSVRLPPPVIVMIPNHSDAAAVIAQLPVQRVTGVCGEPDRVSSCAAVTVGIRISPYPPLRSPHAR